MPDQRPAPEPVLPPRARALIACQLAIGPADWVGFAQAAAAARTHGAERAELEEVLLQAILFYGFPRVVTAFDELARAWPAAAAPAAGRLPAAEQAAAGRALFAAIYGENDAAVQHQLATHHPELRDYVLECAYGRVLARPGLPARFRELLAAAALAGLAQVPQLVAHGRGALRLGASVGELRDALTLALGDAGRAEPLLRRITARLPTSPPDPAP